MSHYVKDGVPYINDKPAIWDPKPPLLAPALSQWRCPECDANLGSELICLNACHLTAAQLRRFNQMMSEASAKVRHPANPDAEYEKRELAWLRQQEKENKGGL